MQSRPCVCRHNGDSRLLVHSSNVRNNPLASNKSLKISIVQKENINVVPVTVEGIIVDLIVIQLLYVFNLLQLTNLFVLLSYVYLYKRIN